MKTLTLSLGLIILVTTVTAATTAYVPVCCNGNSTVTIVSTTTNRIVESFSAGPGSYAVTFPNHASAWVTNSSDNTISVVDYATGNVEKTIQLKSQPSLIQASPDGTRAYVLTGADLVALDTHTGTVLATVTLPNDGLMNAGLVVSPDNSRVYATFDSQTIVVFDVATGTIAATWHTARALTWTASGTLTLSPDGSTLYTSGEVLTAIDTATGDTLWTVNPPGPARTYSFVGSAITADGGTIYASYAAQIGTGSALATIDTTSHAIAASANLGSELQQPVLSKDGTTLYVLDAIDSVLYVISPASLTSTASIDLSGPVATLTLGMDGNALYIPNSSTASMLAVDPSSLSVISSIPVAGTGLTLAGFGTTNAAGTAKGGRVFVGGVQSNSISSIDTAENRSTRAYTVGGSGSVTGVNAPALMATPNGQQIYLASNGSGFYGGVIVIETATGAVGGVTCPYECYMYSMTALPDSSRVYLAGLAPVGDDGSRPIFYVVNTATKEIVAALKIGSVGAMAASPTGTFLYVVTSTGIGVLDTTQNVITSTLPINGVLALGFSPNGSTAYALTSSALESINTSNGQVTSSLSLGTINPTGLTISPDGSEAWITLAKSTSLIVVDLAKGTLRTPDFGVNINGGVAFGGQ
jgi:YVTN family beta-propeller protein